MNSKQLLLVFAAKDAASGVVRRLDKSMGGLEQRSGRLGGAFSVLGGAAKTMALVGIGAAVAAVAGLGAALAAGVKGAMDEQVGIERLNTALANNVAGWDGNRAAIEKVIDARTRLAFDDSALRDSLSSLVARTKDVSAAMDLQALAMDLARAKGIDLATATEIVGKVYSGNVGILTRYGIAVEKGATSTEALAAIQKSTAGQAEAYGNTTKGAFDKFGIAMNNVFEDIGSALLPALTGFATFLSDTLIPTVKDIAGRVSDWFKANEPLITQITGVLVGAFNLATTAIGLLIDAATSFISWIAGSKVVRDAFKLAIDAIGTAFDLGGKAIGFVVTEGGKLIAWISSNDHIMNALKLVAEAIGTAFQLVADTVGFAIGKLGELAAWISNNISTLRELATFLPFIGDALRTQDALENVQGRQHGGRARRGVPYVVGERRPELFVPDQAGWINPTTGGRGGLGSGTLNFNPQITVNGNPNPEQWSQRVWQQFARQARRERVIV